MPRNKFTFNTVLLHLCICAGLMFMPYVFSSDGGLFHLPDLVNNGHDRTYFGIYSMLLVFFYLNFYILIPKLYFHGKYVRYFGILLLCMFFFTWLSNFADRPLDDILAFRNPATEVLTPRVARDAGIRLSEARLSKPAQYEHTVLVFIVGVIGSLCLAISQRLQKMQSEKIRAELSWLKAQINPHFLFNTLNSIYSLALVKDERTAESVIQLSELMRYILQNANEDEIRLDKEINYITNYIALQRSRLGGTVRIGYAVNGSTVGKTISPLILISFIENAFKHGVNPDENSEIDIAIHITDTELKLSCFNKKVHPAQSESGIGMRNTLERLELLYPERNDVSIAETSESYAIELTLQI